MKNKVGILMNTANIGGAEHLMLQVVRQLHSDNVPVVVIAGAPGIIFYQMVDIAETYVYAHPSEQILKEALKDCTTVINNNWFSLNPILKNILPQIGCKYMQAIHGPFVPYLQRAAESDSFVDEYLSFSPLGSQILCERFGVSARKIRNRIIPVEKAGSIVTPENKYFARNMLRIPQDAIVVGMISRISAEKGILDALDIYEAYHKKQPKAAFVILGGDPSGNSRYNQIVEARIQLLRSKGCVVYKTGCLDPAAVDALRYAFDIAINTSQTEGMNLAVSELLSAGIPVLFPDFPDLGMGTNFDAMYRENFAIPVRHRNETSGEQRMTNDEKANYVHRLDEIVMKTPVHPHDKEQVLADICEAILDGPYIMTLMYNTPIDWLREMTASILNQNFKCYRWVIVDDGNTNPELLAHLEELAADDRVTILRHDTNKNIREAQNTALRHIYKHERRMMMIFDSDDIARPDLVGSQFRSILNSFATVLGVQIRFFGNQTRTTSHPAKITADMVRKNEIYPYWFMNNPGVAIWLGDIGERYYPEVAIPASSDFAMWIDLLRDGFVLHNRPDVLVDYRWMGKNSNDRLTQEEKNMRMAHLELIKNKLYENQN
jgi:glycosyltransferase involved in cell wall biosynthesis